MLIYGIIAAVVLGLLGGMYWKIDSNGFDRGERTCKEAIAKAQEKLIAEEAKRKAEAETKIQDMVSAFDAGEKKGAARQSQFVSKGTNHVATEPVFSNKLCVLPTDSLRNLNAARSSVRSSTDPAKTP